MATVSFMNGSCPVGRARGWQWTRPRPRPSRALRPAAGPGPGVLSSLDGTHLLTVEAGNLVLDGRPLTSDAEPPELAYTTTPDTGTTPIQARRSDVPLTPVARWSPDGRRLLTYRVDSRGRGLPRPRARGRNWPLKRRVRGG